MAMDELKGDDRLPVRGGKKRLGLKDKLLYTLYKTLDKEQKETNASSNILPDNPSKDDVIKFMKDNTGELDRNNRCDIVKSKFGGGYPSFWYNEIILKGIRPNNEKNSDYILPNKSFVTLETQKDFYFNPDDLDEIYLTKDDSGEWKFRPHLSDGRKLICKFRRKLGSGEYETKYYECKNQEDANDLYSKFYWSLSSFLDFYTLDMSKSLGLPTREASEKVEDLKEIVIDGRPDKIPLLPDGYKLFCSCNEGWSATGPAFIHVCNTIQGAQKLYDEYSKSPKQITRYIGKFKEGVNYRSRLH